MITEANKDVQNPDQATDERTPVIPGTTWYTPEDAAKGFNELKSLVDRQGNELGMTRKQLEQSQKLIEQIASAKNQATKASETEKPKGPDYDAELAKIDQAIEKLDVDDPGYSKELAKLNRQARTLTAKQIESQTAEKLMSQFETTLSKRDEALSRQKWLEENPDFNTPEMQSMIQQRMASDRTGFVDPVLAYREIQAKAAQDQLKQEQATRAELENRLKLKDGVTSTSTVISKAQSLQTKTNQ
ncbi:MAG: hypothetical protein L7F78_05215, partial [Syntrophales bacterium LBB04]|nr:hypothetical protein [Syntrophales bacterium LBB04]